MAARTLKLYWYHAVLLALTFSIAVRIAERGNRPGLHNLLDYYFAVGPLRSIVDGAFLIYRPPLLDILPMYIIFLLITPIALIAATRIGWKYVLGASAAFWLAAQFGFRQIAYNALGHLGLRIPLNEMGSFDLWAWQFLWMIGLWIGVRWARNDLPITNWARKVTIPALVITPILFVLRYKVGAGFELGNLAFNFDKWHLGVVRLVDFALVAALLIRFQALMNPFTVRPLILLGQSSLQVFCAHLFFCFFGLTIMGNASMVSGWQQVFLLALSFSGLYFTGWMFAKPEKVQPATEGRRPRVRPDSQVLSS